MKSKMLATLALLAISILPGCGKSNNAPGVATYGGGGGYIGGSGGQGGCYDLRNITGATQVAFVGYNQGTQSLIGRLSATTAAAGGGYAYTRTGSGDTVQVFVNGNQMTAIANLSYNTVAAINVYGGGYLCGLEVNSAVNPGTSQLTSSLKLLGGNMSYIPVPYGYSYVPLVI